LTADPIAAYLSMLEHERRLSEHTLRAYTHELDELKVLANGRPLETLTAADMRGAVDCASVVGLAGVLSMARRKGGDVRQSRGHRASAQAREDAAQGAFRR
jgi:site-specific recombinase XerC